MTERNSKEQEFFQQNLGNMVPYMQSLQDGAKLQEQAEIRHAGGENVNEEEEDENWPQPLDCNLKHQIKSSKNMNVFKKLLKA